MLVDVDWNAYDEEAARERLVTAMQFHTLIVTILLCFWLIFVVSSFQPVPQSTQSMELFSAEMKMSERSESTHEGTAHES